jgi:hypothetical protein
MLALLEPPDDPGQEADEQAAPRAPPRKRARKDPLPEVVFMVTMEGDVPTVHGAQHPITCSAIGPNLPLGLNPCPCSKAAV